MGKLYGIRIRSGDLFSKPYLNRAIARRDFFLKGMPSQGRRVAWDG
ncbi:hypothetical protein CKA32_005112 [Geitlerinema sp. FC II]|nr:hypothetical protein CKA32_005112 [Geitlerinema sp. FC II]